MSAAVAMASRTHEAAKVLALAAQDVRDRFLEGIVPSQEEVSKLLQMARNVATHAASTLFAVNAPATDSEGGEA